MRRPLVPLVLLLAISCSEPGALAPVPAGWSRLPEIPGGIEDPELRGTWRSCGGGIEVRFDQDRVSIFQTTSGFTVELPNQAAQALAGCLVRLEDGGKTLLATDHPTSAPLVFRRSGPSDAVRQLEDPWSPIERFDLFAQTMGEHYAFFDVRGVDWPARVSKARAELRDSLTEAELFETCAGMVDDIQDAHFGLSATIDGTERRVSPGKGPTKVRIRELFEQQSEVEELNVFFNDWYRSYRKGIEQGLLAGRFTQGDGGTLYWGLLGDGVGYLQCTTMGAHAGSSLEEELEVFAADLDRALTELESTRGLVLDLTYNTGGHDAFGRALASRFALERRLAFRLLPITPDGREHPFFVEPTDRVPYHRPTVALTSDLTVSAGESLALYLRVVPSVTIAGTPTHGSLSDMLEKVLPGGWTLTLSHQTYVAADGECYEGRGVPVDEPLVIFDPGDPFEGHQAAVNAARAMLRDEPAEQPSGR